MNKPPVNFAPPFIKTSTWNKTTYKEVLLCVKSESTEKESNHNVIISGIKRESEETTLPSSLKIESDKNTLINRKGGESKDRTLLNITNGEPGITTLDEINHIVESSFSRRDELEAQDKQVDRIDQKVIVLIEAQDKLVEREDIKKLDNKEEELACNESHEAPGFSFEEFIQKFQESGVEGPHTPSPKHEWRTDRIPGTRQQEHGSRGRSRGWRPRGPRGWMSTRSNYHSVTQEGFRPQGRGYFSRMRYNYNYRPPSRGFRARGVRYQQQRFNYQRRDGSFRRHDFISVSSQTDDLNFNLRDVNGVTLKSDNSAELNRVKDYEAGEANEKICMLEDQNKTRPNDLINGVNCIDNLHDENLNELFKKENNQSKAYQLSAEFKNGVQSLDNVSSVHDEPFVQIIEETVLPKSGVGDRTNSDSLSDVSEALNSEYSVESSDMDSDFEIIIDPSAFRFDQRKTNSIIETK